MMTIPKNNSLDEIHSCNTLAGERVQRIKLLLLTACVVGLLTNYLSAQTMSTKGGEAKSNLNQRVSYDAVQVVIRKNCVSCHNEDQPRGDLVLTSLDKLLAGSSSGPVVVAGSISESPLYTLSAHLDSPKMPPNKPRISQSELNVIERWINSGLIDEMKSTGGRESTTNESLNSTTRAEPTKANEVIVPLNPLPHADAIRALAAHPTEPTIAIAGFHQVALIRCDIRETQKHAIDVGDREVNALQFSRDGTRLFIAVGKAGASGTVKVLNWQEKKWLPEIGDELDTIQSIDCSHDATQIAIGTTSRAVKVFRVDTGKSLHTLRKHTDWVLSVSFSPDGLLLASGDRFGGIHVWESGSGAEFATLRGHAGAVTGLTWSRDANQLVSSSMDGTIRVWDMHSLQSTERWVAHDKGVLSISRDIHDRLVTGGRDGKIRIWGEDRSKPLLESQLSDEILAIKQTSCHNLFASDASGEIYCLKADETVESMRLSLPVHSKTRMFTSFAPNAPKRSVASSETPSQVALAPLTHSNAPSTSEINSDLEESRRALASVEDSLKQTYRAAEQLEESVARLKQIITLQEARLKQLEIRQKRGK